VPGIRPAEPALAAVARALAAPAKRGGRYVRKAPAHGFARIVRADLDDVVALRLADLPGIELPERIAPKDMPRVDGGVIDPQRRAVEHAGQYPDILNGATFEHPAEVDFARTAIRAAVVQVKGRIHGPAANQPAVEFHLVGAVGGRLVGSKSFDEGRYAHGVVVSLLQAHGLFLNAGGATRLGENC
jgi:hypothetical protein